MPPNMSTILYLNLYTVVIISSVLELIYLFFFPSIKYNIFFGISIIQKISVFSGAVSIFGPDALPVIHH